MPAKLILLGQPKTVNKVCNTARAIAALLSFATIRVEDDIVKVTGWRAWWRYEQKLVKTNAALAIAPSSDLFRVEFYRGRYTIDDHEVIPETVHFAEVEHRVGA